MFSFRHAVRSIYLKTSGFLRIRMRLVCWVRKFASFWKNKNINWTCVRTVPHITGRCRKARSEDLHKLHSSPNGRMIDQSDQVLKFLNEDIPILYRPEVHYSVHRRPQPDAVLGLTGPFETFTFSFPSIGFTIVCSCTRSCRKWWWEWCQHATIRSCFVAMICDKETVL
jgi:hypothetical protein